MTLSKHDLICHVPKVKAATPAQSMADPSIKPKENLFYAK